MPNYVPCNNMHKYTHEHEHTGTTGMVSVFSGLSRLGVGRINSNNERGKKQFVEANNNIYELIYTIN